MWSSRETVRSATSMPTFKSSPWILGAPPSGIRRRHAGDESPDLSTDGRAGPMSVTGSFTEHIRCILQHRRIEPPEEAFFGGLRPSEPMTVLGCPPEADFLQPSANGWNHSAVRRTA